MAEWLATWPVALGALAVLFLPGVLPAYAVGLRGIVAWGTAPLLAGAVVGVAAVAAGALGVPWTVLPVVVGSLVAAAVGYAVYRLSGRTRSPRTGAGPARRALVAGVGVATVVATLLQMRRTTAAVGEPGRVAQTFDTPYHLNSVALILDRGDASSLHMTLTVPDQTTAFYPALWHGVVSLVVQTTGASVAVAANWVTIVAGTVVWVAAMLALGRVLFGPAVLPLTLVPALAFAFTQFPNRLFSFGILYPNFLSYALLPAALAACTVALLRTRGRARLPGAFVAALGAVALVLAQPNGFFALAYVVVPIVVQALWSTSRRLRRAGRGAAVTAAPWVVTALVAAASYWALGRISLVEQFRGKISWSCTSSWQHAVREVLSLTAMHPSTSPNYPEPEDLAGGTASWVVAVLVVVGAVVCLRVARWRWVPFSYAVVAGLYVVVRGVEGPLRGTLTGYWYADPQRLAALLPLLGVPLVVVAVAWLVATAGRAARQSWGPFGIRARAAAGLVPLTAVAAFVAVAVSVLLPRTDALRESFAYVGHVHHVDPRADVSAGLVSADEERMMETIEDVVPEDTAIAGNPWDGSSMTWALAGRRSIFPHVGIRMDEDRVLLADSLNQAAQDPRVCEAVDDLDVGYVLRTGRLLWGADAVGFDGLDGLVEAGVGEARRAGRRRSALPHHGLRGRCRRRLVKVLWRASRQRSRRPSGTCRTATLVRLSSKTRSMCGRGSCRRGLGLLRPDRR